MPWCPNCKNEYIKGITTCVDCGIDLVDELPEEIDPTTPIVLCHVDTEEIAEKFKSYLRYGGLETPSVCEEEDGFDLIVAEFEREAAENMFARFDSMDEMAELDLMELVPDIEKELEELEAEEASQMFSDLRTEASSVYVKKKDKYADLKFSGISFFAFGLIGIAFVIANQMNMIHFFNEFSTLIMGIVFVIFLAVGISSLIRAKKLKGVVTEEEKATSEVMDWMDENINDELIHSLMDDTLSEEDNYFAVHDELCRMLIEQFPFFSRDYADELMDERYNSYCEKQMEKQLD